MPFETFKPLKYVLLELKWLAHPSNHSTSYAYTLKRLIYISSKHFNTIVAQIKSFPTPNTFNALKEDLKYSSLVLIFWITYLTPKCAYQHANHSTHMTSPSIPSNKFLSIQSSQAKSPIIQNTFNTLKVHFLHISPSSQILFNSKDFKCFQISLKTFKSFK